MQHQHGLKNSNMLHISIFSCIGTLHLGCMFWMFHVLPHEADTCIVSAWMSHFISLCTNSACTFLVINDSCDSHSVSCLEAKTEVTWRGKERLFLQTEAVEVSCFCRTVEMLHGTDSLRLSGNQAQRCSLAACWFVSNMAVCSPVANTDTFSLSSFTIWAKRPMSPHLPFTGCSSLLSNVTLLRADIAESDAPKIF